jgi:type II secretion system protein N
LFKIEKHTGKKNHMKKGMVLTGYILAVTFFFLYLLFPTEAVTAYMNYKLSQYLPGVRLAVNQIRPVFPPGLKLSAPLVYRNDKEFFTADQVTVRPRYLTLFSQTKGFMLNASIHDGRLSGSAEINRDQSSFHINLSAVQLEISNIPAIKELTSYDITGVLNGKLDFNYQPPNGAGVTDMVLSDCAVEFKPALFGMNQLKMDTVSVKANLADQLLNIETIDVKGRELNGKASGSMNINNPIIQSEVNVSGQVTPTPVLMKNLSEILPISSLAQNNAFSAGIPFLISGTIESPNFSLR